ncbi:MAG: hypothetical protein CUR33_12395 [Pseudomonas sp.]|uniref:hypothetical protein n=1 Tax=Pseudomonas sp. FEMGT703P TaxID=2080764 RepID=UPI000CB4C68A|nr:hypothetical protein [Pseudomonas sp. FEMGT703P]PJE40938.1 MAG: hypothetical protein CUR33_12395 [Pseudomonas sp.] [Pseudomonas sp. FEMGT703P]
MLIAFEAYKADGIMAVDNRPQAHWINQGKTRWKTLLWVKWHSILSLCAASTQLQHAFSTDLPLAEQL